MQVVTDAFGAPQFNPAVYTNLGHSQITGVEFLLTKEAAFGLSGQLSLTYQNEFTNVLPTSPSENFYPSIPPAALQLGNLYRVGFISPFVGSLAVSYKTHSGWRFNPTIFYNHGYPLGSGLLSAFTVNGVPYNLPNTNVTNSSAAQRFGRRAAIRRSAQSGQRVRAQHRGDARYAGIGQSGRRLEQGVVHPAADDRVHAAQAPAQHLRRADDEPVQQLLRSAEHQLALSARRDGARRAVFGLLVAGAQPGVHRRVQLHAIHGNLPYVYGPTGLSRTAEFYYQLSF